MNGQDSLYGAYELRTNDSSRPCVIRLGTRQERVKCVGVDVPKALLPLPVAQADRIIGHRMTARDGTGALLAGFLTTLTRNTRSYTSADAPRLEAILVDLLAALFAHELDSADSLPAKTRRRALTLRIHTFTRQHLHDPELTPAAIAAAHHISLSHLHRLFQDHGTTVAGWIRHQRLEHARQDLIQSAAAVHTIATRWGFSHHSTFTRAFRAAYGTSPHDYRHHSSRPLARRDSASSAST